MQVNGDLTAHPADAVPERIDCSGRGPRPKLRYRPRPVGLREHVLARFGKSYVGDPDQLAEELAKDAAVREADTQLLTVPSRLGVDHNARRLETITRYVAPAIGWVPPA